VIYCRLCGNLSVVDPGAELGRETYRISLLSHLSPALVEAWTSRWYTVLTIASSRVSDSVEQRLHRFIQLISGLPVNSVQHQYLLETIYAAEHAFDPTTTGLPVETTQRLGLDALESLLKVSTLTKDEQISCWKLCTFPWFHHPYFAIATSYPSLDHLDIAATLVTLHEELLRITQPDDIRIWRFIDDDSPLIDITGVDTDRSVLLTEHPELSRALALHHPAQHNNLLFVPIYAGEAPFAIVEIKLPANSRAEVMLHVLALCWKARHELSRSLQHTQDAQPTTWQRVLARMVRVLTVDHDIEDVLTAMTEEIRLVLPCERITFWEYSPEESLFTLRVVSARLTLASVPAGATCPAEDTPLLVTWHTGHPLMLAAGWSAHFPNYPNAGGSINSLAVIPVVYEYQRFGIITVERLESRPFDRRDIDGLTLVASLVGAALSNQAIHASLRQAQDHLVQQAKMHALGEMAAGIAHDFNNILMALLCNVELLRMAPDLAHVQERLPRLERAILDAKTMVQRVNTFARQEANSPYAPVVLHEVLHDTVEMLHTQFVKNGISIHTDYAPDVRVLGNAAELREVATNLLTNAIQAMPYGGILRLSCERHGGHAWFLVADSGVGMPPAVLARACDPFFSTKGGMGTGLGLSVSYRIVQQHKGTLSITSEEGKGTQIRVELPALVAEVQGELLPATSMAPLRILLVEDNEEIAELLERLLSSMGHQVTAVCEVASGIPLCTEGQFDLVITDFALRGETGDAIAMAARHAVPRIPVLLLSGSLGIENLRGHLYDGQLTKPVTIATLQHAIQTLLASL